jgi:hypothetical protein
MLRVDGGQGHRGETLQGPDPDTAADAHANRDAERADIIEAAIRDAEAMPAG